ncbi:MAG: hypothetical protein LC770_03455, partial [Acidobacteria bacterium]|nr:hypothetical protein [Acidobacteriota bacterium]
GNQLLGMPSGGNSRGGDEFLETLFHMTSRQEAGAGGSLTLWPSCLLPSAIVSPDSRSPF